jgi:TRAP-type C4-dicarboxylate transport system permease small subunit
VQGRQRWWQARADDVAVLLLSAMFLAFVVQVASRYVFNHPLGWTLETCVTLWLWTVMWGSSFCLRHDEHVRFDMVYHAVGRPLRRVFAGLAALAIVVAFALALPATWDFVSFLTIKKSATLRIPLAYVFSIYLLFMVATIVIFGRRLLQVLRSGPGRDHDVREHEGAQ